MIPLILILATPSVCRADLGGPLLIEATGYEQAAAAHFLVGNLLIGCFEAFLLTRWFKTPKRRTYELMIHANHLSAIAYLPLAGLLGSHFTVFALVTALAIALLFTVIIERSPGVRAIAR
jgi:bacteriorhodopsin